MWGGTYFDGDDQWLSQIDGGEIFHKSKVDDEKGHFKFVESIKHQQVSTKNIESGSD